MSREYNKKHWHKLLRWYTADTQFTLDCVLFISINCWQIVLGSATVLYDTLKYHRKCFQTLSTKLDEQKKNVLQKVLTIKEKNCLMGDLILLPLGSEWHALPSNPTTLVVVLMVLRITTVDKYLLYYTVWYQSIPIPVISVSIPILYRYRYKPTVYVWRPWKFTMQCNTRNVGLMCCT